MDEQVLTIIICCYNGADRLIKVLDHIYSQRNIEKYVSEVIVVDNHSTDKTKEIVCSYEKDNILVVPLRYIYEGKLGLSNARKKGVDSCTTDWIVFLDDDNLIQSEWIEHISNYIRYNPKVGVLNGAVIPYVPFNISKDETLRLKASLKVLACTHYNFEELNRNKKTPFRNPIGAGMVIRAEPLKKLSENGWLNSSGRTKDDLTSGEDGEMAFYVKSMGYDFGFCPDAVLYHEMNRGRIQDDYLNKMWYEIGKGVAIVAKEQEIGRLKLLAYKVLLYYRLVGYYLKNKYKGKYYRQYIEGFNDEM